MFGRIAFCNTTSDLFAMGITNIKEVLMILGISTEMTQIQQDVCTVQMIKGFTDAAQQINTQVGGGQTVYNMWPMMGGCAITVVSNENMVMPNNAKIGDIIILTKPLGSQLAINAMQWLKTDKIKKQKILKQVSQSSLIDIYYRAQQQMGTLSIVPAQLIQKYKVHACTDITGFGILGHAQYLAQAQKQNVEFVINKLPIYSDLIKIESTVRDFKFLQGYSAQTSGGLLMCISQEKKQIIMSSLADVGLNCWQIGYVRDGQKKALLQKVQLIEV